MAEKTYVNLLPYTLALAPGTNPIPPHGEFQLDLAKQSDKVRSMHDDMFFFREKGEDWRRAADMGTLRKLRP